jgi:pilus assembly protein CpaE
LILMQFPGDLKFVPARRAGSQKVIYAPDTIAADDLTALVKLFPALAFEEMGGRSIEKLPSGGHVLIVGASAVSNADLERAYYLLKTHAAQNHVVIALRDADVATSRALTRGGAADVIPLPASEAMWALGLERLLGRGSHGSPERKSGQVVVLLKAGGGVGATSLGVQASCLLAARSGATPGICFADLGLQFGNAALYFDLDEPLTVTDCVAVGEVLEETQFATGLAAHKSGVRVLAAPRDPTALDVLTPQLVEGLVGALRRDFRLTILDLPSVWTAWTNQAVQLADRIVLVTHLSVPHVHLVRRQLGILAMQNLDRVPLILACNAVGGDQQKLLSIKAAEQAIGRAFDIVLPEDGAVMGAATNQGLPMSEVRRGSKLERFVAQLADSMAADALLTRR